MAKDARIQRCKLLADQFLSLKPHEYDSLALSVTDFDGLSYEESKASVRGAIALLEGLSSNDAWNGFSWHALNSIESILQQLFNLYPQLKANKDQGTFQSFVQHIDSFIYHCRMFGAFELAHGSASLERTTQAAAAELERLTSARAEVEKLSAEVRTLIAPAVAGSLSEAFTARKTVLLWGRIAWGCIALAAGGYCIYATYSFADAVGQALAATKSTANTGEALWASVLIRSVVLLPLYAAFGFSFSQYKKERDFEEEYAHKAAVATSLPNYGDLTREPAVRDQIVTGATNVIFSAPTSKRVDAERSDKVLGSVKEVIDSIAKLIPGKKGDA